MLHNYALATHKIFKVKRHISNKNQILKHWKWNKNVRVPVHVTECGRPASSDAQSDNNILHLSNPRAEPRPNENNTFDGKLNLAAVYFRIPFSKFAAEN